MRWLIAAMCALLALAPAAQAKKFFGGVVPDIPKAHHGAHTPLAHAANLPYGGGPVLHSNRTHVIYWQPAGTGLAFDPGYMTLIDTFLKDVAADSHKPTNPYGLSGQYRDAGGPAAYKSSFGGSVLATDRLPPGPPACGEPLTGPGWPVCVDDQELVNELNHVIVAHHLPQTGHDIYFLVTPRGLGSCTGTGPVNCALGGATSGSYCGYHSTTPDGLAYAVIPYNAVAGHCQSGNPRPNGSTADPTISTISHEHNETVTDPQGDAWIDSGFNEDGDLCISTFGPPLGGVGGGQWNEVIHRHHYYLQEEWSNADGGCEPRARPDELSISAPAHPRAKVRSQFTAIGSAPQARIVSYNWWFGDGRTARGRRPKHVYKRAGTYRVIVRATDSWDNWVLSARAVKVRRHRR